MDTKNLKAYAPQARRDFIAAVTKRAAQFCLYEDRIADVTVEGSSAIIEGRVFTRKQAQQRSQLANRISELGFNEFINEVAFTWVNRLTAIRYMEVNGYLEHGFRILSMPPKKDANGNEITAKFGEGFEILAHAADVAEHLELDKSNIVEMLLAGDKEEELYREILLGECHQLSKAMPFMFEKLDDATELLLPDNLTKTDSILKELVDKIPETDWLDIEVIGWLYQFYISEHKDAVIGKVVKKEDIPAATQLFTPNWIVKYLVQNSLGRQWLATYPESELKDKMEYYIAPAEQGDDVIEQLKAITPTSIDPEAIKVLDPACGSGHILVEVYEVLREIYLERGYRSREIPELILTKNIYGLDIDDRAAQMAAFAVLMKAREDDRRIFDRIASNDIKLNIRSLQSTEHLDMNQLWSDLDLEGKHQVGSMSGLFEQVQQSVEPSAENKVFLELLHHLKTKFTDAKILGSLIDINSKYLNDLVSLYEKLLDKVNASDTVSSPAAQHLLPIIEQAILLSTRYDAVVANPPYMGSGYFNSVFKKSLKKRFKLSRTDLYALFIERNIEFLKSPNSIVSMVTRQDWMFTSSYQEIRKLISHDCSLQTLTQLGAGSFPSISGEVVQASMLTYTRVHVKGYIQTFIDCTSKVIEKTYSFKEPKNHYFCTSDNFPISIGSPILYQLSKKELEALSIDNSFDSEAYLREGIHTGDNGKYVRSWWEVSHNLTSSTASSYDDFDNSQAKWVPYNKGGTTTRWYEPTEFVLKFDTNTRHEMSKIKSHVRPSQSLYFKEGGTWSDVATKGFGVRYYEEGHLFDGAGPVIVSDNIFSNMAILNSLHFRQLAGFVMPNLHFKCGTVKKMPFPYCSPNYTEELKVLAQNAIDLCKEKAKTVELFPTFEQVSFIHNSCGSLQKSFIELDKVNYGLHEKLKVIEEKINKTVAQLYELPLDLYQEQSANNHIIVKYNIENIIQMISYTVACMMGRFSLDKKGLVYAHSGNEGFKKLVDDGVYNSFPADDDGIIPLASEAWLFDDDATARFREFIKTVWGEENLQDNLGFVAESLCQNAINSRNGESSLDTIRRYFSTQFYKDHLKTYKKRPIYWLFSSGKEKAFECLVYLHRYNEGTLSRMRTEYVTPLMGKFESQTSILRDERDTASSTEQRRIDKELKLIERKQAELRTFDEELKHISELKISLDLDDGVKVNYGKFGNLLANVKDVHGKKPEVVK